MPLPHIFSRPRLIIINYYKKNITFHLMDCGIDDDFLFNYNMGQINVSHDTDKITFSFDKKETVAAVGIFLHKWKCIDDWELLTSAYLIRDDGEEEITDAGFENVIDMVESSKSSFIKIEIRSDIYNLTNEKGIIAYYNLNDRYDGELLDDVFKNKRP